METVERAAGPGGLRNAGAQVSGAARQGRLITRLSPVVETAYTPAAVEV